MASPTATPTSTSQRPASPLSFSQIEDLWIRNGGSPTWAPTMAAVALAESGGRTNALNSKAPDYSVGLWQINYYGNLRDSRTARYGSPEQLSADPNRQAKAAIDLLGSGSGITNWKTDGPGAQSIAIGGPLTASQAQAAAAGKGGNGSAVLTSASGSTSSCDSNTNLINGLGVHLINQCQLKALKGGLFIAAGGLIMIVGVVLMIGKASNLKAGVGYVVGSRGRGAVGAIPGSDTQGATRRITPTVTDPDEYDRAQARGRQNASEAGPFPEA